MTTNPHIGAIARAYERDADEILAPAIFDDEIQAEYCRNAILCALTRAHAEGEKAGIVKEREACAQLAEAMHALELEDRDAYAVMCETADNIADGIRTRGEVDIDALTGCADDQGNFALETGRATGRAKRRNPS